MLKFFNLLKQKGIAITLSVFSLLVTPQIVFAAIDEIVIVIFLLPALLLNEIGKLFAEISNTLFSTVLTNILNRSITGNSADSLIFLSAWAAVRDWANMLIVVGLIGIALATILNLEKYRAQKLLVPLIIIALLVNFSVVFVGIVIDASNIIMRGLVAGATSAESTILTALHRFETSVVDRVISRLFEGAGSYGNDSTGWYELLKDIFTVSTLLLILAACYIATGLAFLYASLLLLARYAILAFLFIVSPLAFVFWVFPVDQAKKLWNDWWEHFLKWCFAGLGISFAIKLSSDILNSYTSVFNATFVLPPTRIVTHSFNWWSLFGLVNPLALLVTGGPVTTTVTGEFGLGSQVFNIVIALAVVLIILFIGIRISSKVAPKLAAATMGIAKTAGLALATGGLAVAGKLGMGVARATGAAGVAQRAKEGLQYYGTKLGETRGIRAFTGFKKGTADLRRQERIGKEVKESEAEARYSAVSSEERLEAAKGVTLRKLNTPKEREEAVGVTKALLVKGEFGNLDFAKQKELMRFTRDEAPGTIAMGEFTRANADLAKYDKDAIGQEKRNLVGKESNTIDSITGTKIKYQQTDIQEGSALYGDMQKEAERRAVRKASPRMSTEYTDKLTEPDAIAAYKDTVNTSDSHRAQILTRATKEGWHHKLGDQKDIANDLNSLDDKYDLSNTRRTLESKDPHFAAAKAKINPRTGKAYDEKTREEIIDELKISKTTPVSPADEQRIQEEAIRRAVGKLSTDKFADLDENVVDKEIIDAASEEQIKRALQRGSKALKQKMADALISDVDNIDKNLDKITLIPETDIDDAINRQPDDIKKKLRNKFAKTSSMPAAKREVTEEEIEQSKKEKEAHMKKLGLDTGDAGMIKSFEAKKTGGALPTGIDTAEEYFDYLYQQRALAEQNKVVAKTTEAEQAIHMEQLAREGHVPKKEQVVKDFSKEQSVRPTLTLKQWTQENYLKGLDNKRKSFEPKKTLHPGDQKNIKREEQEIPEEYHLDSKVQEYWDKADKEKRERLEQFLEELMNKP